MKNNIIVDNIIFTVIEKNIFDFNYLRLYVPNLSNLRKTDLVVTNGYGSYTGSPDQRFTFLKTPSITGVRTLTGTQGGTWTGYGNDIYYAQNLFLANNLEVYNYIF